MAPETKSITTGRFHGIDVLGVGRLRGLSGAERSQGVRAGLQAGDGQGPHRHRRWRLRLRFSGRLHQPDGPRRRRAGAGGPVEPYRQGRARLGEGPRSCRRGTFRRWRGGGAGARLGGLPRHLGPASAVAQPPRHRRRRRPDRRPRPGPVEPHRERRAPGHSRRRRREVSVRRQGRPNPGHLHLRWRRRLRDAGGS